MSADKNYGLAQQFRARESVSSSSLLCRGMRGGDHPRSLSMGSQAGPIPSSHTEARVGPVLRLGGLGQPVLPYQDQVTQAHSCPAGT